VRAAMTTAQQKNKQNNRAARRKKARMAKKAVQRVDPFGGLNITPVMQTATRARQQAFRRGMVMTSNGPAMAHLSACARKYLAARIDPWSELAKDSCIPDQTVLNSQKLSCRARGFFSSGTNAVGWISLDPWAMIISDPVVLGTSLNAPVVFTQNNYTPIQYQWSVAAGNLGVGTNFGGSDSNLATSYFTPAAAAGVENPTFRLVGAGIRIRYTGAAINRGGRITAYRSPNNVEIPHGGAVGGVATPNSSDLLQTKEAITDVVSSDWHSVAYVPTFVDALAYNPLTFFFNPTIQSTNRHTLLMYVDAPSATPIQFEYDCISHFELIGYGAITTPSHSDPVGMGAVQTATTAAPISQLPPQQQLQQGYARALESLATSASGILYSAGKVAGRAAMTLAAGAISNWQAPNPSMPTIEDAD